MNGGQKVGIAHAYILEGGDCIEISKNKDFTAKGVASSASPPLHSVHTNSTAPPRPAPPSAPDGGDEDPLATFPFDPTPSPLGHQAMQVKGRPTQV